MFEHIEDWEEFIKAQGGVAEAIVTKQVTFRTKVYLCFDLDRRETFVATEEQWRESIVRCEEAVKFTRETGLIVPHASYIETETGRHYDWVWRPDGNYSEYEVSK